MPIALLGDGQMGLVMADALAAGGAEVRLWGPFAQPIDELARTRRSPQRLPDFVLAHDVAVTADLAAALDGAEIVVNAIPTQFIAGVWEKAAPRLADGARVLCISKGFEVQTLRTPTEIITDVAVAAGRDAPACCALSGPTIAAELARHLPATMVAASPDDDLAGRAQVLLHVPWLRVYRHDDLLGVEVAGATKNVIALAAGMVDGLDVGYNAKSALLARGLAEIARLGVAMGAKLDTFFGVAGVGDLATTCFCPHGRNRTCGERLGAGEPLDAILASMVSVVEGVPTTKAVAALARRHAVEMPITDAVHRILFEGLSPRDAIRDLMEREAKVERVG